MNHFYSHTSYIARQARLFSIILRVPYKHKKTTDDDNEREKMGNISNISLQSRPFHFHDILRFLNSFFIFHFHYATILKASGVYCITLHTAIINICVRRKHSSSSSLPSSEATTNLCFISI